jgi:hypothetical protein
MRSWVGGKGRVSLVLFALRSLFDEEAEEEEAAGGSWGELFAGLAWGYGIFSAQDVAKHRNE